MTPCACALKSCACCCMLGEAPYGEVYVQAVDLALPREMVEGVEQFKACSRPTCSSAPTAWKG